MSHCRSFNCKYEKNQMCLLSKEKCTGTLCTSFFAKCDVCTCGEEKCIFKTAYLKGNADYISILAYKEERRKKINTKRIYAVKNGRVPGIYRTWEECLSQIDGFENAKYQQFTKIEDAEKYLKSDHRAVAYVDGSYNKDTKEYGYGIYLEDLENGTVHELSNKGNDPNMATMRNVAGEIAGAMAAITYAKENGITELQLCYDYIGVEAWVTGKWSANKKETQLYRDFAKNSGIKLNFKKVKSHSGIKGNERADSLAKKAIFQ